MKRRKSKFLNTAQDSPEIPSIRAPSVQEISSIRALSIQALNLLQLSYRHP
ncbi:hypothetical protein CCACVL1_26812 [Corchorus capsularis]|uniref:Uncharacterized protein n=1 Tax=Corchorus capsularis TaxID=210143 RepID=A0A1R3GD35_COCAP|nr:hypothetical protein CCACVL1_26812 [Corchorus capsularis]